MNSMFDSRFARTLTLTDDTGSSSVRGFLEPVDATNPETPVPTPAGRADERRYLVILPLLTLTGGVSVADGDTVYRLLRRETIAGDHIEAVAVREEAVSA